jgi:hypothetical protein
LQQFSLDGLEAAFGEQYSEPIIDLLVMASGHGQPSAQVAYESVLTRIASSESPEAAEGPLSSERLGMVQLIKAFSKARDHPRELYLRMTALNQLAELAKMEDYDSEVPPPVVHMIEQIRHWAMQILKRPLAPENHRRVGQYMCLYSRASGKYFTHVSWTNFREWDIFKQAMGEEGDMVISAMLQAMEDLPPCAAQ